MPYTVVKWGHTEGIEREKLCLKIPRVLPSIFELFLVFQIWGHNTIGGQYLQNINALIFWCKYLQKVNEMPSDFWWKNNKFCSIDEYFLIRFLKDQKLFVKEATLFFFSSEIWGHCIHFLQVIKSEYEGI